MEQGKEWSYTVLKRKQKRGSTPMTDKSMQESRWFNPPPLCVSHSQEIGHMCFTCESKCLCSNCFNEGAHKLHDVKSLDRSYSVVESNLNEYLIRIKSKSDLLSLLHDGVGSSQNQLHQDFQVYKEHIENSFDRVIRSLEQKRQNMIQTIARFHQQHIEKTKSIMGEIRQAIKDSMSIYRLIERNIKDLPNYMLCFFYADKKKNIDELVNEENLNYFKHSVPVVKWNLQAQIFQQILQKVDLLDLSCANQSVQNINGNSKPILSSNKLSKKKLRKFSKLPNLDKDRVRKPHQSHPLSPQTPKDLSRQKTVKQLCRRMKSPGYNMLKKRPSGKMLSMPASPSKQKKQCSPTIIIDHQKKKAKKKL